MSHVLSLLLLSACSRSTSDTDPQDSTAADDTSAADDSASDDDTALPDDTSADDTSADDTSADDTGLPDYSLLDPYVVPAVSIDPPDAQPGDTVTLTYTGPLDTHKRLAAHYGFNGWKLAAEGMTEQTLGESTTWFAEVEMTPGDDGFTLSLDIPTDARALLVAFTDPDDHEWDNNDDQDYHWGFGAPYISPYLTWNETTDPASGVVLSWQSSAACLGIVEYGTTEDLGLWTLGETFDTMHHIVLADLPADSTVYYRVRDSTGVMSEVQSFQTAQQTPEDFRFVVMGDMQDGGDNEKWAEVAAEVLSSQSEADFLLAAGDLPDKDSSGAWWLFFDMGKDLFGGHVLMPTVGNHDTVGVGSSEDTSSFLRYFDLPGETAWYTFDYGATRFLGLSTEHQTFTEGDTQYVFVQDALADATGPVFAAWHKPPYDAGARHAPDQQESRPVTVLFDGAVDWVFNGHEHLYQRMVPIRFEAQAAPSGQYGRGANDGVGYVVLPSAGTRPASQLVDGSTAEGDSRALLAWPVVAAEDTSTSSELGYVVVHVTDQAISIDAYGMGDLNGVTAPHLLDSVTSSR